MLLSTLLPPNGIHPPQNCPFSCLWTELGIYQQIGLFLALETNYVIYNLNFFKSLQHIPAMLQVSREYLKSERLHGALLTL